METIVGDTIGSINIVVYETANGGRIFRLKSDNDNVTNIIDIIEDTLLKQKKLEDVNLLYIFF